MSREAKVLGAREVASKLGAPGFHALGNNLYLRVERRKNVPDATTASYVLRYMLDNKAHAMGLGSYRRVSLKTVRQRALEALEQKQGGIDPLGARKARRAAQNAETAKAISFKAAAEQYIKAHNAKWKNPKHAAQWTVTLEKHAYPAFGDLPVGAIDKALVTKALDPIWHEIPETANRVRGRIEAVLSWATAKGLREGDNPARWKGHLEYVYPARSKIQPTEHHEALPYAEIGVFTDTLKDQKGVSALALQFTILTAARTGETIGAKWNEIDLDQAVWTVPAERMKAGKEHRVPLSKPALTILKAQQAASVSAFVFPGADPRKPLSNMAMLEMLRGKKGRGLTVHGFRSTFRDWAGECTDFPRDVIEMALAHTRKDKTEASYARGDLFVKRRALMDTWATFCMTPADAKVIPLRTAAQ